LPLNPSVEAADVHARHVGAGADPIDVGAAGSGNTDCNRLPHLRLRRRGRRVHAHVNTVGEQILKFDFSRANRRGFRLGRCRFSRAYLEDRAPLASGVAARPLVEGETGGSVASRRSPRAGQMALHGTEFAPASASLPGVSPTRAVRIVAVDIRSAPFAHASAARLISAVFSAAPELGSARDAVVVLAVGGAPHDAPVHEVLSFISPGALRDPRSEKTCLARLRQIVRDAVATPGDDESSAAPESDEQQARVLVKRVSDHVCGRFGAARVHVYIASTIVAAVSSASDVPPSALLPASVCQSVRLFAGESDRDVGSLFGEAFACLMSSRVTLRVGASLLQLVARPRIRGAGCLPPVLSLIAYRRVSVDAVPEDVLFGIPTALLPDADAERDAASKKDAEIFADLAAALASRREALVAVERNGPHLVLLPTSAGVLLLREVACKDTLLPAPAVAGPPARQGGGGVVDSCIAAAAPWSLPSDLIDDVTLSTFDPLDLDGAGIAAVRARRAVGFCV
jgi:hypothetical protein